MYFYFIETLKDHLEIIIVCLEESIHYTLQLNASNQLKKSLKIFITILFLLCASYFLLPEYHIKQTKKASFAYLAKELKVSAPLAKFIVSTKVGRKIGWIVFKRKQRRKDKKKHNPQQTFQNLYTQIDSLNLIIDSYLLLYNIDIYL